MIKHNNSIASITIHPILRVDVLLICEQPWNVDTYPTFDAISVIRILRLTSPMTSQWLSRPRVVSCDVPIYD